MRWQASEALEMGLGVKLATSHNKEIDDKEEVIIFVCLKYLPVINLKTVPAHKKGKKIMS